MPDTVDETPETDLPNDRDEELAKTMDNDMDLNPYLTSISEPTEDTIAAQSTTDPTSIMVLPLEASFLTHLPVENTAKAAAIASAGGGAGKRGYSHKPKFYGSGNVICYSPKVTPKSSSYRGSEEATKGASPKMVCSFRSWETV
jgi:hypothetical protein